MAIRKRKDSIGALQVIERYRGERRGGAGEKVGTRKKVATSAFHDRGTARKKLYLRGNPLDVLHQKSALLGYLIYTYTHTQTHIRATHIYISRGA